MVEPLSERIKRAARKLLCRIFHHEYGCCNNPFKNCRKCLKEDYDL